MKKPPRYKLEAWRPWHYVFDSGISKVPLIEKELSITREVTTVILDAMYKIPTRGIKK